MSSYSVGSAILDPILLVGAAAAGIGQGVAAAAGAVIEFNDEADRLIQESHNRKKEEERQRVIRANAARDKMKEMEETVLKEAERKLSAYPRAKADLQKIKKDLLEIKNCQDCKDVGELEYQNIMKYSKLTEIVRRIDRLADIYEEIGDEFSKNSVHEDINRLHVVLASTQVSETRGKDIIIPDDESIKRKALNAELTEVASKIVFALGFFDELECNAGISKANRLLFSKQLLGTDQKIEKLLSVSVSNKELEAGIRELKKAVAFFDMLYPTLLAEKTRKEIIYKEYAELYDNCGKKKKLITDFEDAEEISKEIGKMRERVKKAEKCRRLFQKMGKDAYICYAIDSELSKFGYTVQSRGKVNEIAGEKLEHGMIGEKPSPFYLQESGELTQFYKVSDGCALQLVIHEDGAVSMQTLSDHGEEEAVKDAQKKHCSQLKEIQKSLMENWYISIDQFEEEDGAEIITEIEEWRINKNKQKKTAIQKRKEEKKKYMHMKNE